jgi:hypothetical protein
MRKTKNAALVPHVDPPQRDVGNPNTRSANVSKI